MKACFVSLVWFFCCEVVDALCLSFVVFFCVRALDMSDRVGPGAFFVFCHGNGLAEVGDEGGDVGEKSRARDNVRHGESNVREEGRGEASARRGGTRVQPVVVRKSVVVAMMRLWYCSGRVGSGVGCLSGGVVVR